MVGKTMTKTDIAIETFSSADEVFAYFIDGWAEEYLFPEDSRAADDVRKILRKVIYEQSD